MNEDEREKDLEALKRSFLFSLSFTALLWIVRLLETASNLPLSSYGIRPKEWIGLPGILFSPLLHGDMLHLFSNTPPLILLGGGLLYLYRESSLRVAIIVVLLGGFLVWLFGRPANHIGASGLIYGMGFFIFISGVQRRSPGSIALALIVVFLYGGMVWGVFPQERGVSWEGHLFGALSGSLCAFWFRRLDLPPPPDFGEDDEDDLDDDDDWEAAYRRGEHPER